MQTFKFLCCLGTHSIRSITKSYHTLVLGEFAASIPLLDKIGNQSRMLNSYVVMNLTVCVGYQILLSSGIDAVKSTTL